MAATSRSAELFNDYEGFVAKFEPKRTTDDCYTPQPVYSAVLEWAAREYGLGGREIVRPFYPGGDYERFGYPWGCVVVDNPPFSILAQIVRFYVARGIDFFLFAPGLTTLGSARAEGVCAVCADADITYENGAKVRTNFVTNLDPAVARTAPGLHRAVKDAVERVRREQSRSLPSYEYPDAVLTAAMLNRYSKYGIDFRVMPGECARISALDHQREHGKAVFGGGVAPL